MKQKIHIAHPQYITPVYVRCNKHENVVYESYEEFIKSLNGDKIKCFMSPQEKIDNYRRERLVIYDDEKFRDSYVAEYGGKILTRAKIQYDYDKYYKNKRWKNGYYYRIDKLIESLYYRYDPLPIFSNRNHRHRRNRILGLFASECRASFYYEDDLEFFKPRSRRNYNYLKQYRDMEGRHSSNKNNNWKRYRKTQYWKETFKQIII